jgi:hypothetical protein
MRGFFLVRCLGRALVLMRFFLLGNKHQLVCLPLVFRFCFENRDAQMHIHHLPGECQRPTPGASTPA